MPTLPRPSVAGVATVVALGSAACVDDDWRDDPAFVLTGDHITVYAYDHEPAELFAGSLAALETHTRAVEAALAISAPTPIVYRWMSFDFMQGRCPDRARACIDDGEVLAQGLPDMGVVARYLVRSRPGGCPAFLEHGVAQYLSGPSLRNVTPSGRDVRSLLLTREPLDAEDSARAGHFVSYLAETHGAHSIPELCDAVGPGDTLDRWVLGFDEALGVDLDTTLTDYAAYPLCETQQFRARSWECAGPVDFTFSDAEPEFEFAATTTDPRTINATPGAAGDAIIQRLVYLPEGTSLGVRAEPGAYLSVQCAPCSASPQVVVDEHDLNRHVTRGGLHSISVFFDSSTRPNVILDARW